ncbi:MAG TPA: endonuclease [Bacteroidales bacterium]|nr:endonuclease [Bacteroidales bacterium]
MKKNHILLLLTIFSLLCWGDCYSQCSDQGNSLKIVFYNCENFFDTDDDPRKNDNEFLPENKKNWTLEKYNTKVSNISRVIYATDSINLPDIVGLCEIENQNILEDLAGNPYLKKAGFQTIHFESSDDRGIDVALLYDPVKIKILYSRPVPVDDSGKKLREILYVKAIALNSDTINVFVNHWKSRSGGTSETQPKRVLYALALKKVTDSLLAKNQHANIIIMGDFNDEPGDVSVSASLGALPPVEKPLSAALYNLFYDFYKARQGSYYYTGEKKWNMMDQIILSGNFFSSQKSKLHYVQGSAEIFRRNWMLYKSPSGELLPSKTYSGTKYHGGFSDHLPVTIQLEKQKK